MPGRWRQKMLPGHHALAGLPFQLDPRLSRNATAGFAGHLVFRA
jgi:hypothetical protein